MAIIDNMPGMRGKKASSGKPVTKISVPSRVMDAIKGAIFSGSLEPGDPVLELHLARQHKVSQSTVREALSKLEHAGLVRRIPNKGTFVIKLSPQELREHLRLRVVLESLAAVEAARWMTKRDFEQLDRRLQEISSLVSKNAYYELAQADLEFHRYIWERSGDKTLYRMLDQLSAPLFAYTSIRRSSGQEELKRVVLSHEPITAALRNGGAEAIRAAVRNHIECSYDHFSNTGLSYFEERIEAAR